MIDDRNYNESLSQKDSRGGQRTRLDSIVEGLNMSLTM